jgi:hypothetical protein
MHDTSTSSWKLLYEAGRQALQSRKLQEAEQSFSAALQLAEDFAGGDPRLAATLNALARIYSLQRRYLAAAALLNRLLEVTERTLGGNHVQVAGVLTNLAEMYTHLGAAREELELRERVLAIRADDPNADANTLQRLRERVGELQSMLAAENPDAADELDEMEPLPVIRTAEYTAPTVPVAIEPEVVVTHEQAPIDMAPADAVTVPSRDEAYRLSPATAQMTIAPWPGPAATTPTSAPSVEPMPRLANRNEDIRPSLSASGVELISVAETSSPVSFSTAMDHGFSDMGRDEMVSPIRRRVGTRSSLISIAAGVVLVAGIVAARSFVAPPEDARMSAGSVSLATANAPAVVVPPVMTTPVSNEPKTVDRLVAERAERAARRSDDARSSTEQPREVISERTPRAPTAADMERTLRGLDGAVKAIDQRARATADSMTAIRVQTPTFKSSKVADP